MHMAQRTVLVVDDDDDLREAITDLLLLRGYHVTKAANGHEALDCIAAGMPDVILLDMKMPVMNGWEFARAFREAHDSEAPIVVVTAADDARRRAEEIRADGWLGKPFESVELYATVERYLDSGAGGGPSSAERPGA